MCIFERTGSNQLQQSRKGSLIVGHVCFGRDWKECCFIYGSQELEVTCDTLLSKPAYIMASKHS